MPQLADRHSTCSGSPRRGDGAPHAALCCRRPYRRSLVGDPPDGDASLGEPPLGEGDGLAAPQGDAAVTLAEAWTPCVADRRDLKCDSPRRDSHRWHPNAACKGEVPMRAEEWACGWTGGSTTAGLSARPSHLTTLMVAPVTSLRACSVTWSPSHVSLDMRRRYRSMSMASPPTRSWRRVRTRAEIRYGWKSAARRLISASAAWRSSWSYLDTDAVRGPCTARREHGAA